MLGGQGLGSGARQDLFHLIGVGQQRRLRKVLDGPRLQSLTHEIHPDGQSHARPFLFRPERAMVVESHPDAAGDRRREPDKPGVREIVGGPGLAGDRVLCRERFGPDRGARVDGFAQHGDHEARDAGGQDIGDFRPEGIDHGAVVVRYLLDDVRRDVHAVVRKRGESRGVLDERQVRGAQGERKVGDQPGSDPELAAELDHLVHAHAGDQTDCRHVPRLGQRVQQRDRTLELVVVVVWRPDPRRGGKTHGSVEDGVERAHTLEQGLRVEEVALDRDRAGCERLDQRAVV